MMSDAAPRKDDDAFAWLVEKCGGVANLRPSSTMAKLFKHGGPSKTREFRRIHALPRRVWEDDPDLDELVELLTEHLCTPFGEMKLWNVQAVALRDLFDRRGLFAPIAVGKGKALISLLAAVLLQAERPLLIVPAQVREQTNLQVLPEMQQHWHLHPELRVITYWDLSQEFNATILEDIAPDLIVADEVHRFKNRGSGRTKRMSRYMTANPETIFAALSGTVTNRSIRDYDHILRWCLKEGTPLPETWQELCQWADVLDVLPEEDEGSRSPAGALEVWTLQDDGTPRIDTTDEENPKPYTVRQGYRDRLVQTPGVVATKANDLGVSLLLKERKLDVPDIVLEMLAKLAITWETPNGDLITEAVDLWRHARELCCGFWYRWDPAPPRDWLDARKAWKQHVRETLKHNRRKLDTELQVWNEIAGKHGQPKAPRLKPTDDEDLTVEDIEKIKKANARKQAKHESELAEWRVNVDPDHCFWCKWLTLRRTFKINNVAEWVDDFAIRDAAKWLDEVGGIVWTEHTQWAERLAQVTGVRFFGPGKKANIEILTHIGPMIASIKAHGEGKNLQHHHNTSLVVAPPSSGKTWEQLLGREHRPGQPEDEVIYEVYRHAEELRASIKKAFNDARYLEHTLGTRQKLLYADKDFEVRS